jgi:hypothetical protein
MASKDYLNFFHKLHCILRDGLLKDFLSEYIKENNKTCKMYENFYVELSTELGLYFNWYISSLSIVCNAL